MQKFNVETVVMSSFQDVTDFNILVTSTLSVLSSLRVPERQPHRAVRTTDARNKHCEKVTSRSFRTCDLNFIDQYK